MGLEKAIKSGKEHRKPYKYKTKQGYAKSVDQTCRNNGSCFWCRGNRLHKFKKSEMKGSD